MSVVAILLIGFLGLAIVGLIVADVADWKQERAKRDKRNNP